MSCFQQAYARRSRGEGNRRRTWQAAGLCKSFQVGETARHGARAGDCAGAAVVVVMGWLQLQKLTRPV